jgi:Ran GTPase-activating protein (RanGAP) involved in mRNA processing and transport
MEFKEVQEEFKKLSHEEDSATLSRIKLLVSRNSPSIDLSNYFLFPRSSKSLLKSLSTSLLSKKHCLKSLVLQNCLLTGSTFTSLLKLLKKAKTPLLELDIANNRIQISPVHAEVISLVFSRSAQAVCLSLKGNNCADPLLFSSLFNTSFALKSLNLYDSCLSAESLLMLSKAISFNRAIFSLDLGFNSAAFENYVTVSSFAQSVGENSRIERLSLNENGPLAGSDCLLQLCEGLKLNRSLCGLELAGVGLTNTGISLLCASLLSHSPLPELNVQNNHISDSGLQQLLNTLPQTLSSLDLSYNTFSDPGSVAVLALTLENSKSLSSLDISHCFELEDLDDDTLRVFCSAISRNDSLTELKCEGFKVPMEPDEFCGRVRKAIEARKLSLVYRLSAICAKIGSSTDEIVTNSGVSEKIISSAPSHVWESQLETEKKDYIDSPNQEPIISTSRHFTSATSFE